METNNKIFKSHKNDSGDIEHAKCRSAWPWNKQPMVKPTSNLN